MLENTLTTAKVDFSSLIKKAMTPKEALIVQLALNEAMEKGLGLYSATSIEITLDHYSEACGLEPNAETYLKLKEDVELLFENSIKYKDKKGRQGRTRIISSVRYSGTKSISIDLCSIVVNEALANKEIYKIFNAQIILQKNNMKKKFSKPIYDILLGWGDIERTWFIGIDNIQKNLDIHPIDCLGVEQFKKQILEPALAEINEFSHLFVTYQLGQDSNGEDAVAFEIKPKIGGKQEVITKK